MWIIIWLCFVIVYKFGYYIIFIFLVVCFFLSLICNEDFEDGFFFLFFVGVYICVFVCVILFFVERFFLWLVLLILFFSKRSFRCGFIIGCFFKVLSS